jgi:asparagine synthetase B (glutamine-hydrolysing)
MCGILFVKSKSNIALEKHLDAFHLLNKRGPDFSKYSYKNGIFIGQTVLHITSTKENYTKSDKDFLAYNGEIYNYRKFGYYSSDVELVQNLVPNNVKRFQEVEGPWAWIWTDFENVLYATDPQFEKQLFRYQDDDILIICSEVLPILQYRNFQKRKQNYKTKHWSIFNETPWIGIERISSGFLYDESGLKEKIVTIFDWKSDIKYDNYKDALDEFKSVFCNVIEDMTPKCEYGLSYSGGLDSSCIAAALKNVSHFYSVDCVGKDNIPKIDKQILIQLNEKQWADDFIKIMNETKMPVQSWSFVGYYNIAKNCQEKVLFTGTSADELFGGYPCYDKNESPYSEQSGELWNKCLEFYDGEKGSALLLADYITQSGAVDLRGIDLMISQFGIEPRNVFSHPKIIKYALNLPLQYKRNKIILRDYSPQGRKKGIYRPL